MFSMAEKQEIAAKVEALLLSLEHPEMPKEKPNFRLIVEGAEPCWSTADILPNWRFSESNPPGVNPWNEVARDVLKSLKENPNE